MIKMKKIPRCYTCEKRLVKNFIEVGVCNYCSDECIQKIRNKASYPYKLLTDKEYHKFHDTNPDGFKSLQMKYNHMEI